MLEISSSTDDEAEGIRTVREEERAEESSSSLGSLASIGVDEATAARLLKDAPRYLIKRRIGRPPTSGQFVGYADAMKAAAESV